MLRLKVFGSSNIGLYFKGTNNFFIYHSNIIRRKVDSVRKELDASPIPVYLVDTLILSPFIIANSKGVVVSNLFESYAMNELRRSLKELDVNFKVVESKYTALGNVVLVNDKGAVSSPILSKNLREAISDILDVEVATSTLGRFSYIGSLAVVNNRYGIVSSSIKEDEKSLIEEVLDVKLYTGTVNSGVELISSGLVVNDHGVVIGEDSSGKELMQISTVFEADKYYLRDINR